MKVSLMVDNLVHLWEPEMELMKVLLLVDNLANL